MIIIPIEMPRKFKFRARNQREEGDMQKTVLTRVLKNKHQAVSQGVRRFGKRSILLICEHLQKPHNAGSRP
jgi:hypothetical protein